MATNIVATITGNGAALTAEINKTFGAIPGMAKNVGKELGNLFDTEFEKGARKAETAARASARSISEIVKSATVTNGAVQFDSAGIKATIAARNQELQVMEALLQAKQRLVAKDSDATRESQVYLATLRQTVNEERQAIAALTSKAQVLDNLQAELGQTAVQQSKVNAVSGQARAGMQQLSFQISDVSQSFASGVSPMVIFGQQASQVIQAVGMMTTKSSGLVGFLLGPWGAALTAAATILGTLYFAHQKAGDGADGQGKKEKSLTERIEEQNQALRKNIELQGQKLRGDLSGAVGLVGASSKERDDALAEQQKAKRAYLLAKDERGSGATAQENIEIETRITATRERLLAATDKLRDATDNYRKSTEGLRLAQIQIADRRIAGATDRQVAETNRYEDALGKLNEQLTSGAITMRERNVRATELLRTHEANKAAIESETKALRENAKETAKTLLRPSSGQVLSQFGADRSGVPLNGQRVAGRRHEGVDIRGKIGDPVLAPEGGIAYVKNAPGGLGLYVEIKADSGARNLLAHLSDASIKSGSRVEAGQLVGLLGDSGNAKGGTPHLHWQRQIGKNWVDPMKGVGSSGAASAASDAARDAKKAQDELAASLKNVISLFDPAAQAAAEYRLQLQEIKNLESAGVAKGGISAEDAKRYRDELAESHAAKLEGIEDARHAKFMGNMSKEFQLAGELGGDVAEKMVSDYLATTEAAEAKIVELRQQDIDRQRQEFEELASFYERAFQSGGRSIWSDFKQLGKRALAELAAQATIKLLGGGGQSGGGGLVGGLMNSGINGIGNLLGLNKKKDTAGDVAGSVGGASGLLNKVKIPGIGGLGDIAGAAMLAMTVFGGLMKKTKTGSATLSFANGELGVGATRGNSQSRIGAAKDGIGAVGDMLTQIAETLGGSVTGAGSVSLGMRKKSYVVDPTGQGRTKGAGVLKFKDEQDAIEAAMRDALQDGVIEGISAASKKILASGQDLQKAIMKASMIESIPKALKARLNPVGAALDALNEKWDKTIAALKEGGASAEQMADAEKLYRLEREDALKAANDNLKEFINSLNFGSSSTNSLMDQSKAARADLDKYLGNINSGNFGAVDQQKYLQSAQSFLDIQRELGGSGTGWFNSVDELRTATQKLADGLEKGSAEAAARDPFAEATASATQATADILAQQTTQLASINGYLASLAAGTSGASGGGGGSSFIGSDRSFVVRER